MQACSNLSLQRCQPCRSLSARNPSSRLLPQRHRLASWSERRQRRRALRVGAELEGNGAGAVADRQAAAAVATATAAAAHDDPATSSRNSSGSDEDAARGSLTGTLLVKCPDSKGVVASVAQVSWLAETRD